MTAVDPGLSYKLRTRINLKTPYLSFGSKILNNVVQEFLRAREQVVFKYIQHSEKVILLRFLSSVSFIDLLPGWQLSSHKMPYYCAWMQKSPAGFWNYFWLHGWCSWGIAVSLGRITKSNACNSEVLWEKIWRGVNLTPGVLGKPAKCISSRCLPMHSSLSTVNSLSNRSRRSSGLRVAGSTSCARDYISVYTLQQWEICKPSS